MYINKKNFILNYIKERSIYKLNSRYEIFNCDVYIENGYNKKQRKKHNLKKKNQEKKIFEYNEL